MQKAIVIRGTMSDSKHVVLDEPVEHIKGPVEVTLRPALDTITMTPKLSFLEFVASLPPGTRSKADIDQQIADERDSWGDR